MSVERMLRDHAEMNAKSTFRRICKKMGVELVLNDQEVLGCFGKDCAASSGRMGDHPTIMLAPLESYSSVEWAILCFWHEMGHLELNESAVKQEYQYERTLHDMCNWGMEFAAWNEAIMDAYQYQGVLLTSELAQKIEHCLSTYHKQHNFHYNGDMEWGDDLAHGEVKEGDVDAEKLPPPATPEQVEKGEAAWCWACNVKDCMLKGKDILVMCDKFAVPDKKDSGEEPKA